MSLVRRRFRHRRKYLPEAHQPKSCTHCGAPISHNRYHCLYCGVDLFPAAPETSAQSNTSSIHRGRCARCHNSLSEVTLDAGPIGQCERCGGTWVPAHTLHKLRQIWTDDDLNRPHINVRRSRGRGAVFPRHTKLLKCPDCGRSMRRVQRLQSIGGASLPEFDRCEKHGNWYDEQELLCADPAINAARTHSLRYAKRRLIAKRYQYTPSPFEEIKMALLGLWMMLTGQHRDL